MFALDPAKLAASFEKPVLVVQGERDLQVSVADAERLKQAAPNAKLLLLPDTNHVLKTVKSADRAANMVAYTKANVPFPRNSPAASRNLFSPRRGVEAKTPSPQGERESAAASSKEEDCSGVPSPLGERVGVRGSCGSNHRIRITRLAGRRPGLRRTGKRRRPARRRARSRYGSASIPSGETARRACKRRRRR